ncbi:MAG: ANTAR domain-containing protein [Synergistaceae bacterium]
MGYLTKPIVKENVLSTLEICLRRSKEYHLAQKEYKSIEKRLESRKYIDKAKLLIMEQNGISETEAYETIRELSHLKGLSMEEISKYITTEGRS